MTYLLLDFNLSGCGKLVEDLAIHKELVVGFQLCHSLRDGPRRLVQRTRPCIGTGFQVNIDRLQLAKSFKCVVRKRPSRSGVYTAAGVGECTGRVLQAPAVVTGHSQIHSLASTGDAEPINYYIGRAPVKKQGQSCMGSLPGKSGISSSPWRRDERDI